MSRSTMASAGRTKKAESFSRVHSKSEKSVKKRVLSRTRKPDDMNVDEWQIALRRQHGREQKYDLKKLGKETLFGDYEVTNHETRKTYKIAVRSHEIGRNFCSCLDFKTNGLGTCKHVEFVLATLESRRGFKKTQALAKSYSSLSLSYGEPRGVVFRPGTECSPELAKLVLQYFHADGRLKDNANPGIAQILDVAAKTGHEVRCYDDALLYLARLRDQKFRLERLDGLFDKGIDSEIFKTLLKVNLHRYQREGVLFAVRAGRAIIADEMGLGKTIQAIAAAEIFGRCAGVKRVLIIAPTSLKYQWQQEIERFSTRDAQVISGHLAKRHKDYHTPSFFKITNYDVIHRDRDAISAWAPDVIILDEAQRIKNWQTRAAKSVKELESEFAIVLTGTPLENRIEELHSIVQFVDRFRLGPLFRFQHEHRVTDESGAVTGYQNLDKIATTLKPILIRRHKKDVLSDLPKRSDKTFLVDMTPQQRDHHDDNQETVARIVRRWRQTGFLSETDQLRLRIALQNMRMSCNSTYLLDHKTDYSIKIDEAMRFLGEALEEPDMKAVVFSQWIRTHELLIRRIEAKGWGYVNFNGTLSANERRELIQKFKEDKQCRLFLSTDAGGVGLNLQNASVVVNMDLPWNPAVLEQRVGRVHRLGQERPVRVVNFVAENTIEQGMMGLLQFKTSLFAGVLDGGESTISLGGSRLKKFMETVEKVTTEIPTPDADESVLPDEFDDDTIVDTADNEAGDGFIAMEPQSVADDADEDSSIEAATDTTVDCSAPAIDDTWRDIATNGLAFIDKLARLFGDNSATVKSTPKTDGAQRPVFRVDRQTNRINMDIPLPSPETMFVIGKAAQALVGMLENFTK